MKTRLEHLASAVRPWRLGVGMAALLGAVGPVWAGTVSITYGPGAAVPGLPVWGIAVLASLVLFIVYREHKARNRRLLSGLFLMLIALGGVTAVVMSQRADAAPPVAFTLSNGGTLDVSSGVLNLSYVAPDWVGTTPEMLNLTGAPVTIRNITVSGTCVTGASPTGVYAAGSTCTVGTVLAPNASCHVAVYDTCLG